MTRIFSKPSLVLFSLISVGALGLSACSSDSGSEPAGDGDGDTTGDGDVSGDGGTAGDGDLGGDGDGDGSGGTVGDGDGDGDTAVAPSGTPCDRQERVGSFTLNLGTNYTTFQGAVSDGITPGGIPAPIGSSGTCELLTAPSLLCATPCASGTVCAGDDMCIPEAIEISAGLITVTGAELPISEDVNGITGGYNLTFNDPYPGFEVDAAITLTAAGDEAEAFSLMGEGVGQLTSSSTSFNVTEGEPLELSWDPAGASAHSSINISLSVNTHGGVGAWIECSAEDTGSFSIPADLLQQLVDLGLSGFPRVTIARRTIDSTEIEAGCVDFAVASDLMLDVTVDGLVSCNGPEDCPDGQTCNATLYCE